MYKGGREIERTARKKQVVVTQFAETRSTWSSSLPLFDSLVHACMPVYVLHRGSHSIRRGELGVDRSDEESKR